MVAAAQCRDGAVTHPDLTAAIADPTSVPADHIPDVIGELERVKATLWARVTFSPGPGQSKEGNGDDEVLFTVPEVARRLGVPEQYAYELTRRGELPAVRFGKYVRVRAADLAGWIDGHCDIDRRYVPAVHKRRDGR
jgi:excisionase family DNA binding protein